VNGVGERRRAAAKLGASATKGHYGNGNAETGGSTVPDWLAKKGVTAEDLASWRDSAVRTWESPEAQAWLADVKRMHAAGELRPSDMAEARKRLLGDE
jgi:hypothetical protein